MSLFNIHDFFFLEIFEWPTIFYTSVTTWNRLEQQEANVTLGPIKKSEIICFDKSLILSVRDKQQEIEYWKQKLDTNKINLCPAWMLLSDVEKEIILFSVGLAVTAPRL